MVFYKLAGKLTESQYANPPNGEVADFDSKIPFDERKLARFYTLTFESSSIESLPSPQHRHFKKYPGSPTPEADEFILFNRALFYQNLNSSSQYLRRDSIS